MADRPGGRRRAVRWALVALATVTVLLIAPEYVRAYRIHGPSDAPTYLWDDIVLVNRAAYDLRVPFSRLSVVRTGAPRRGDVVLLRLPGSEFDVTRRVVGLPGDTIELRDSRVVLNGKALDYEPVASETFAGADPRNKIGSVVELEAGAGPVHPITYTPGECGVASAGPFVVPPDRYFVLGDNRDHCTDSRRIGAVDRRQLVGKLVGTLRSSR